MSNLSTEKRVDKNGKLVTRHLRVSGESSSSMAHVPAPSIKHPKLTQAVRKKLCTEIKSNIMSPPVKRIFGAKVMERLGDLEDADLLRLKDVTNRLSDKHNEVNVNFLLKAVSSGNAVNGMDTAELLCNDFPFNIDWTASPILSNAMWGLMKHDLINSDLSIPEDKRDIARAHVHVTSALADNSGAGGFLPTMLNHLYISSEPLKNYIEKNAEHSSDIARIIKDRSTSDPDYIDEVLQSSSKALSSGVL